MKYHVSYEATEDRLPHHQVSQVSADSLDEAVPIASSLTPDQCELVNVICPEPAPGVTAARARWP